MIFFTSRVYKKLFIKDAKNAKPKLTDGWTTIQFFMFVVVIEHLLLVIRIVIEKSIDDVPIEVLRGERNRQSLVKDYQDNRDAHKEHSKIICRPLDIAQ